MSDTPNPDKAFGNNFDILRITDEYSKSFTSTQFFSFKPPVNGIVDIAVNGEPFRMAWDQLVIDGYAVENPKDVFYLKGIGHEFIKRGAYAGQQERNIKIEKLNEDQLNSVIKTNTSVRTINKLFWVTLIIALISCFFQGLTWHDARIQSKEPTKSLQEQILQMQQQIDSAKFLHQHKTILKDSLP